MKKYRLSVRIKGIDRVFDDGFEPGVIATKDIIVKNPSGSQTRLAVGLAKYANEFMTEVVEVDIEEQT
jgi:ethanolamine utilization protein EutQ (cupin superfamily)